MNNYKNTPLYNNIPWVFDRTPIINLVWPEKPQVQEGGMRPHILVGFPSYLEDAFQNYMERIPIPTRVPYIEICGYGDNWFSMYEKLVGAYLDTLSEVTRRLLMKTMEIYVDKKNPKATPWQSIRVAYHVCPYRLVTGKPRMTCSLTYFAQKYMDFTPTDEWLKQVYCVITGDLAIKFGSLKFHLKNGGDEDAYEVFSRVYTNVNEEGMEASYPSVDGSCMRKYKWTTCRGSIGVEGCAFKHPVYSYCVPQLGLAWLEDKQGFTTARTLVNLESKAIHRVYSSAPKGFDQNYADQQADYLLQQLELQGFKRACDTLDGVQLNLQWYDDEQVVAPYLDGDYNFVTADGICTNDDSYALWDKHNPPVQNLLRREVTCYSCNDRIDEDDAREVNGNWYCEDCFDRNYNICSGCDEYIRTDNTYFAPDGQPLCRYCFDRLYTQCDACGDAIHNEDIMQGTDNSSYCPTCFEDRFYVCFDCNEPYRLTEEYYTNDYGDRVCEHCFELSYCHCSSCGEVEDQNSLNEDNLCRRCAHKEAANES